MNDDRTRNQVTAAVAGIVVQAGTIGHLSLPALSAPTPPAMFSMRGDIPDFVGRADELRALLDAVTAGPGRGIAVYTVDGMPGVGKTAFCVHAAHQLANHFPDGQIFLELFGHSSTQPPRDPADALASLLVATGVDPAALPQRVDDRARLWRDRIAGKKILLVLDDAAGHGQLRPLLPGTPECFVLITSRHRLPALDGAYARTMPVLPADQATHLLLTLAHRDPADTEAAVVARVVGLCGQLPLAIALAAGRLRTHLTWSLGYLADLLAEDPDRLVQLAAGDRSIRAAFAVSYRHLAPDRQRVFALLGVHPGPSIDAYAVAALAECSLATARDQLEALHADHLIQETAPGRYRLHDLLRVFAGSLATASQERAMRRVLNYYLFLVSAAEAHIPSYATPTLTIAPEVPSARPAVDTQQRARTWLDTELATIAACLDHATDHPELTIALAAALHNYLRICGAYEQALHIHRTALAAAERTHDRCGRATAFTNLGRVYYMQGNWARAERALAHALDLFAELGDRLGQAQTLHMLGRAYRLCGDGEQAERVHERAQRLFSALGDRLGQASGLNDLGRVYYLRGDWVRAERVLGQAHRIYTDLGHRHGLANALLSLGRVHHRKGDHDKAFELLTAAHAEFADIRDPDRQADVLNSIGDLALDYPAAGDPGDLFTRAHIFARTIGAALHEAHALVGLGRCAGRAADQHAANTAFNQALAIYQRLGSPEADTVTRYLLGPGNAESACPSGDS